jgi:hypothetical protein
MDDALDTYNKSDELCSSLRWSRYVLLTRSFLMVLGSRVGTLNLHR